MGFFDFFKRDKKLNIRKVTIEELQEDLGIENKNAVSTANDVKVSKKNSNEVRLAYVSLDGIIGYGVDKPKISVVYGKTCNFKLPDGMEMSDAYRVISYLSNKVDLEIEDSAISEANVQGVAYILENYGFERTGDVVPDYSHFHEFIDYKHPRQRVNVSDVICLPQSDDAEELLIVDGDLELFTRSDMFNKNFDWFVSDVTFKDVKKIYSNIGLNVGKNGLVGSADARVKQ